MANMERTSAELDFLAQLAEGFFAVNVLHLIGFHFVVAAIERAADLGQFRQVTDHGVFDDFFGRATGGDG